MERACNALKISECFDQGPFIKHIPYLTGYEYPALLPWREQSHWFLADDDQADIMEGG